MTVTCYVSDIHLSATFSMGATPYSGSLNSRARECIATLARAIEFCLSERADVMVYTGDLFETANPNPYLVYKTRKLFELAVENGMQIIIVRGNHDLTTEHKGDNCIAPMFADGVHIVDEDMYFPEYELLCCPYKLGMPASWLPSSLKNYPSATRLVLHCGLSTDKTPFWLAEKQGAIKAQKLQQICKKSKISKVYMGDWHCPDRWAPKGKDFEAYQIGTLIPHSMNDAYAGVGRVAVERDGEVSMHTIPGPRFVVVDAENKNMFKPSMKKTLSSATDVYVSVKCIREDYESISNQIKEELDECAPLRVSTHLFPKYVKIKVQREKDEEAIRAVSASGNLDSNITNWVAVNSESETVSGKVVEELRTILRQAKQ